MTKSKILVVDDSEEIRTLVERILKDKYTLEMASNSEEALEKAQAFSPDLILLDIVMPETSGYEVCSQMKSIDKLKDIPIIFLSAKTGSSSRITGYKLGAIQYIEKPFESEELREVINTILNNIVKLDQSEIQNYEEITLNIPSQEVLVDKEKVHFTSSEFKILHLMLRNINRLLSREKILNHISPDSFTANDRMIDTYISALRKKIKKSSFQIKSIYGEGYKITRPS